jgi:hypothetical protein
LLFYPQILSILFKKDLPVIVRNMEEGDAEVQLLIRAG